MKHFLVSAKVKMVSAEAPHVSAEAKMVSAEAPHGSAEPKMVSAEVPQVSAEPKMVSAEVLHVSEKSRPWPAYRPKCTGAEVGGDPVEVAAAVGSVLYVIWMSLKTICPIVPGRVPSHLIPASPIVHL